MSAEHELREHLDDLRRLARAMLAPTDATEVFEVCRRMIDKARHLGDRRAEFDGHQCLGIGHSRVGELDRAREHFSEAIELARGCGDLGAELRARQGLLNALHLLGQHAEALAEAERVAASEDWMSRCTGLISIASIRHSLAEYGACVDRLAEAEAVLKGSQASARDRAYVQTYIAGNRTNVFLDTGRLEDAREESERMDTAASLAGEVSQALEALFNSGIARTRLGDLAGGWQALEQALQAAQLAGDRSREAAAECGLAEWHTAAGLAEDAVERATRSLGHARELHAQYVEVQAELALAAALLETREPARAGEPLERATALAASLRAPYFEIQAGILRSRLALCSGSASEAARSLEPIADRAVELAMDCLAVEAGGVLSLALSASGEGDRGLNAALRSLAAAQRIGAKHLQWRSGHAAGKALESLGRPADAVPYYREATETIEAMWWPLWRLGFAEVHDIGASMLDVYMAYLSAAERTGQKREVSRILAVSPWPFLKRKWAEAGGQPAMQLGFGPSSDVPWVTSSGV